MLFETTFNYAGFEINAATDDSGHYWISNRTTENVFGFCKDSIQEVVKSESFKSFTGKDFALGKIRDNTDKSNIKKSWLSLSSFLSVCYWQAQKDNKNAINMVFASSTDVDFSSTVKEHLGNALDYNNKEYIRGLVFNHIANFKAWTDVIRVRCIELYGVEKEHKYYKACVAHVNKNLFGVSHFKRDRSDITALQQTTIIEFEKLLLAMSKKHPRDCPKRLIVKALEIYNLIY